MDKNKMMIFNLIIDIIAIIFLVLKFRDNILGIIAIVVISLSFIFTAIELYKEKNYKIK